MAGNRVHARGPERRRHAQYDVGRSPANGLTRELERVGVLVRGSPGRHLGDEREAGRIAADLGHGRNDGIAHKKATDLLRARQELTRLRKLFGK